MARGPERGTIYQVTSTTVKIAFDDGIRQMGIPRDWVVRVLLQPGDKNLQVGDRILCHFYYRIRQDPLVITKSTIAVQGTISEVFSTTIDVTFHDGIRQVRIPRDWVLRVLQPATRVPTSEI